MKNAEIPWNISIRYYLDGKEYAPEELAGKSGELEIKIKITENSKADGSFYENYALQATVTLDTETCSNIEAADATIANVGKNKQLVYTILPNRGIDTVIRATVSDFEMEPIAINGIRLNLDVEVDDTEITKQLNDMIDAANMVNDGAVQIKDGTATFASEVSGADDKVNEQIDSVLSDIRGGSEVVSFVSDKNTNVDAVQFVIKTAAIETEEAEAADSDSAAKHTFWEKLWNLFKSDKTKQI